VQNAVRERIFERWNWQVSVNLCSGRLRLRRLRRLRRVASAASARLGAAASSGRLQKSSTKLQHGIANTNSATSSTNRVLLRAPATGCPCFVSILLFSLPHRWPRPVTACLVSHCNGNEQAIPNRPSMFDLYGQACTSGDWQMTIYHCMSVRSPAFDSLQSHLPASATV
jgi:hypothetical protein